MRYKLFFEKKAEKQLSNIDQIQRKIIVSWIKNNLENSNNPRFFGKPLKGNLKEYWRYRVGKYRIIAEINDVEVRILIVAIGHRRDTYR